MSGTTTQEHAEQIPRVSILCRTMNRPELLQALDSVRAQSYQNLELVLVDASGRALVQSPALPAPMTLQLYHSDQPLDRPRAANAALDRASGDLLLFLDEDDWIADDHIANLVRGLNDDPTVMAAYSNVRKASQDGTLLDQSFCAAFDRCLLMRDNYIPIHAVLFSRRLLALGCRFDESFAVYEDWDFWQQCARHTDFLHVDKTTAFYRQGGQSETALRDEREKYRTGSMATKARVAVLEKWLPTWSAADLNAVLGTMDNSEFIAKLEDELRGLAAHREELLRQLDDKRGALERAEMLLADKDRQLADQRINFEARISQLEGHLLDKDAQLSVLATQLSAVEAQRAALEGHLQDVLNSSSWRITRPWRWLGRRIRGTKSNETHHA